MTFYQRFIKTGAKGFSLKGGPFAKWRYPLNKVLYRKRLAAGPEPERPRSVWSNWNYDSEVFAFAKRLNENFNEQLLRQALIDPSYIVAERTKLKDIGVDVEIAQNNLELAQNGEKLCAQYLKSLLNFWYPKLPNEGVKSVIDYLTSVDNLSHIAINIGLKDIIKTEEFPVKKETLKSGLYAIIGALSKSKNTIQANLFINDFILTQMVGKDINEIWQVKNPMGLLTNELKKNGVSSLPVPRLLWSTGANHPTGVFMVGLYIDKQLFSKGSGETLDIAEEMAARDGLRRLFQTTEDSAPLPFGEKARKYSQLIDGLIQQNQSKQISN